MSHKCPMGSKSMFPALAFTVKEDREGWYRIAKNGRIMRARNRWENLYVHKLNAESVCEKMNAGYSPEAK